MEFYCTAGRGTELFLKQELRNVFQNSLEQVRVTDGKVFFKLSSDKDEVQKVLELKTAERAFIQILQMKTCDLDQKKLVQSIKNNLNDANAWKESLAVLQTARRFQSSSNDGGRNKYEHQGVGEPVCKRTKVDVDDNMENVTFRVNFKCPACFRKRLNSKLVPGQIGMHVRHLMGWNVELKHPLLEICVQLTEELLTVGFPLTKEPLSRRSFIKMIGLRSTVAHIMTELLQIQPGETVIDPMCGKATILLEAAHCHKNVRYIGIDKSGSQLEMARKNCQFAGINTIQLINGDAMGLPFQNHSIEKIVTDAPFGNTHTTDIPLEEFYIKILQEFSRVLISTGKLVILTSCDMKNYITIVTCKEEPTIDSGGFGNEVGEVYGGDTINNIHEVSKEVEDANIDSEGDSKHDCDIIDNKATETSNNKTEDAMETVHQESEGVLEQEEFYNKGCKEKLHSNVCDIKQKPDDFRNVPIAMDDLDKNGDDSCKEKKSLDHSTRTKEEKTIKNSNFVFLESHYVKLGETHAYICVLQRRT